MVHPSEVLPGRVRAGYATGSLVTGAFGTVPGLLLLPYLTDTLGVATGIAGLLVLAPKAWDVLINPVAGRVSDRTRTALGARRPFLLGGGLATLRHIGDDGYLALAATTRDATRAIAAAVGLDRRPGRGPGRVHGCRLHVLDGRPVRAGRRAGRANACWSRS